MVSKGSSRFCPLAVGAAMLKITKAAPFSAGEATIFFRRQAELAIGLLAGRLVLAVDWLGSTRASASPCPQCGRACRKDRFDLFIWHTFTRIVKASHAFVRGSWGAGSGGDPGRMQVTEALPASAVAC